MILEEGRGSRQSWLEPGGAARAVGAVVGAASSLPALGPPAQPVRHGRDIACDQRSGAGASCPQKSPGFASLLGEEISNLSGNQTAESEQKGEKKEMTGKTKPKLTPFVIENIQYGEASPPVRVARGTTCFLITPQGCSGVRWKSKATRSSFPSHHRPSERARDNGSHRSPAAGFWRRAPRHADAACVIKKPVCWGHEGHRAPARRSGAGSPWAFPLAAAAR